MHRVIDRRPNVRNPSEVSDGFFSMFFNVLYYFRPNVQILTYIEYRTYEYVK
jgi:hypothetical protein